MKQKFNKNWNASKKPRKQRKYLANAPIHLKKQNISSNLSEDLRKKYKKRSLSLRKGDKVKVMRGKMRGKEGKITQVMLKVSKVIIDGIQIKKKDGSKVNIKMEPSNLQLIELNLEEKKRLKRLAEKK